MSMDDLDPNDFYRSNDMGIVTYFKCVDFTAQAMQWENGTCYWVFRITDALLEHLDLYQSGNARVNPRDYNRRYAEVKREFYENKPAA